MNIICVCTSWVLLKYLQTNQDLVKSSRFILDEFHERRAISDVLFAFMQKHTHGVAIPN